MCHGDDQLHSVAVCRCTRMAGTVDVMISPRSAAPQSFLASSSPLRTTAYLDQALLSVAALPA